MNEIPAQLPPEQNIVNNSKAGHEKNIVAYITQLLPKEQRDELGSIVVVSKEGQFSADIKEKMQLALAIQDCRTRSSLHTGFEILFPEKMPTVDRVKEEARLGLMIEDRIKMKMKKSEGSSVYVLNQVLKGQEVTWSLQVAAAMEYFYGVYQEMATRIVALDYSEHAQSIYSHRIQHPSDVVLEAIPESALDDNQKRGIAIMRDLGKFADPRIVGIFNAIGRMLRAHSDEIIKDQAALPKNHPVPQPSEVEVAAQKARFAEMERETKEKFKGRNIMQELRDKFRDRKVWD